MQHRTEDVYGELPPSLRRKLHPPAAVTPASGTFAEAGRRPQQRRQPAAPPTDLIGLVPIVSHASIATKLANKALPLENPAKTSDRRKCEQEVKRDERQKVKIANKRKRSGRLVRQDASGVKGSQHPPLKGKPLVRGRVSYELMEPLHHLWLGYISELLGVPLRGATSAVALAQEALQPSGQGTTTKSSQGAPIEEPRFVSALENGTSLTQMQAWQSKFVKADFHGCKVEVVKAKHPSLVGLAGIVVQETAGTFRIVTSKNEIKVLPKENVTYTFDLPLAAGPDDHGVTKDLRFELHGGNFAFRGSDRSNKKFKAKGTKGMDF